MSNTANSIISPQAAFLKHCDMAAVTACTTRGPTATANLAAANIVIGLAGNGSADQKVSKIAIKADSTAFTSASVVAVYGIWHWDGTTAYLIDEIVTTVVTPSTTVVSFYGENVYDDLVIPATHALYFSVSITTAANTTATVVSIHGASM